MRVQLEIPENQMSRAIDILAWRSKALKVTIEPMEVKQEGSEWQDDVS